MGIMRQNPMTQAGSFAGHETTTGLIGNTVRRLLEDPSRWAEITAHPYPALRLVPDQQFTFHPNISFRGPQVLLVQAHP